MKLGKHALLFSALVLFHSEAAQVDLTTIQNDLLYELQSNDEMTADQLKDVVEPYKTAFKTQLEDIVKSKNEVQPGILEKMFDGLQSIIWQLQISFGQEQLVENDLLPNFRIAAFQVALEKAGTILNSNFAEEVVDLLQVTDKHTDKKVQTFANENAALLGPKAQDLKSLVQHSGILKHVEQGKEDLIQSFVEGNPRCLEDVLSGVTREGGVRVDRRDVMEKKKTSVVRAYYMLDEVLKKRKESEGKKGWFKKLSGGDGVVIKCLTSMQELAKSLLQVMLKAEGESLEVVSKPAVSKCGDTFVVHAETVDPKDLFTFYALKHGGATAAAAILGDQMEKFKHLPEQAERISEETKVEAQRWLERLVNLTKQKMEPLINASVQEAIGVLQGIVTPEHTNDGNPPPVSPSVVQGTGASTVIPGDPENREPGPPNPPNPPTENHEDGAGNVTGSSTGDASRQSGKARIGVILFALIVLGGGIAIAFYFVWRPTMSSPPLRKEVDPYQAEVEDKP